MSLSRVKYSVRFPYFDMFAISSANASSQIRSALVLSRNLIGQGRVAQIYVGNYYPNHKNPTVVKVAVKVVFGNIKKHKSTKAEIENLTRFKSASYIIHMIEYRIYAQGTLIIMELMQASLDKIFSIKTFSELELLQLLVKIVKGMAEMHAASIVHNDLKLENILLTEDLQPKIADLELSAPIDSVARFCGSLDFIAPELFQSSLYLTKAKPQSDTYSFGIILLILLCTKKVLTDPGLDRFLNYSFYYLSGKINTPTFRDSVLPWVNHYKDVTKWSTLRKKDNRYDPALFDLMLDCTRLNPLERPSDAQIIATLNNLIEKKTKPSPSMDLEEKKEAKSPHLANSLFAALPEKNLKIDLPPPKPPSRRNLIKACTFP